MVQDEEMKGSCFSSLMFLSDIKKAQGCAPSELSPRGAPELDLSHAYPTNYKHRCAFSPFLLHCFGEDPFIFPPWVLQAGLVGDGALCGAAVWLP